MTLKVDGYQEQQMRQRLVTVMNARSDEVDVFMTLPSREGEQFAAAGWYADLSAMSKNEAAKEYDLAGLSQALLKAGTFNGKLTSMPMNIEGPILYYRTDILKKCGVEKPATIKDVEAAAEKIKACDSTITPFVSRGLKPAIAYTFSNMLHNIGGSYMANGKSNLCSPKGKETLETYSRLLRDYGPPGVVNYSFQQISALYRSGRVAMSFESSNELRTVMDGGERLKDTGLAPFPAGEAGQVPTAIGWGMAVSAYSKQPKSGLVLRAMGDQPGDSEAHGVAGDRAAAAGGRQRSRIPQVDRCRAGAQGMAGRARRARNQGILRGRLSDRRQSRIARIHRPGRAGSDPEAEDRRSGLCRCRQGARCADRAKV